MSPQTPARILAAILLCCAAATAGEHTAAPQPEALTEQASPAPARYVPSYDRGRFVKLHWYRRGAEHGNPKHNGRFRVNDPGIVLHKTFGKRTEVRGNGLAVITMQESLFDLTGAELYLEIWGGHPGTAGKRLTVNGRSTYHFPPSGTAQGHTTHDYPLFRLERTDLVNGYNAIQFACERGASFWGHFIVDNACLRAVLGEDHPELKQAGLAGFKPDLVVRREGQTVRLRLEVGEQAAGKIASVHYVGRYAGYDENGNTAGDDWHGMTKDKQPCAVLGASDAAPYAVDWDLGMVPDQRDMAVRAVVRFRDPAGLAYETAAVGGIDTPDRGGAAVKLFGVAEDRKSMWSRAGRARIRTIRLPIDPRRIEKAQFHIVVWDGGKGSVSDPVTLNGRALEVVGRGRHDVIYKTVDVDPSILRRGDNAVRVLSDAHHHGIEVLLPGPALTVRHRAE